LYVTAGFDSDDGDAELLALINAPQVSTAPLGISGWHSYFLFSCTTLVHANANAILVLN
jgi:hypothetical protein